MSSLWTPEGEHRVASDAPGETAPAARPSASSPESPGRGPGSNEADLEALERELVAAPVEAIVANHCFGLFQLAALHLAQRPPNLEQARLAIDALGAVVETIGGRLGEAAETLNGALAQVRLVYVELSTEASSNGASVDGGTSSKENEPGA